MKKNITVKSVILTLILFAACFISMSKDGVLAAESAEKVDDYYVQQYTAEEANGLIGQTAPTLSGYIFSGWYAEKACTTPIRENGVTAPCYAKFVKETVLGVKCQTAEFVDGAAKKSNLRFVSSVDGKHYATVGFEIVREDGKTYHNETSQTYKRIVASDAAKVSYEYSPQVIDTESSSFITYTIKNIPEASYGTVFYVQPFWKTLDGVKVFGVCRYVAVSDCKTGVVNIPVKVAASETAYTADNFTIDETSVLKTNVRTLTTVSIETNVAVRYWPSADYVSIVVGGRTLDSLTMYEVSGSGTTKYLHRNLNTKYTDGTYDCSWYDVANAYDAEEDEYVIATNADMYGFVKKTSSTLNNTVSGRQTFNGKTVYMVADIMLNDGEASDSGMTVGDDGNKNAWGMIGNGSYKFQGTFDGNNHSVSGIYINKSTTTNVGMFNQLADSAVVKNVTIENSYISGKTATGVIACQGGRKFSNINVEDDVYVISSSYYLEGLVAEGEKPIIDAWFFTHPHADHMGIMQAFIDNPEYANRVVVNGIYYNMPGANANAKDKGAAKNSSVIKFGSASLKSETGIKPEMYRVQMGQRYYFNDITIDIAFTQEQILPDTYVADINEASTWCMVTIEEQPEE